LILPGSSRSDEQGEFRLSVIIPALNEQDFIGPTLTRVMSCPVHEVIVVDGHSGDRTASMARDLGAKVISSEPGRGLQLDAGAQAATGNVFLFLHADTLLPRRFARHVQRILAQDRVAAGAFRLHIDGPQRSLRLIERAVDWRSRAYQLPYGDQALFMQAKIYHQAGGFSSSVVMEDYQLVARLKRLGRVAMSPAAVVTSDRKWRNCGVWRVTLMNQMTLLAYYLGASPRGIDAWRRGVSARRRPSESCQAGTAKTFKSPRT